MNSTVKYPIICLHELDFISVLRYTNIVLSLYGTRLKTKFKLKAELAAIQHQLKRHGDDTTLA